MDRKSILTEIESDMKLLYSRRMKGAVDREDCDSLANVAGKRLKAVQLDLADDIFVSGGVPALPAPKEISA